MTLSTYPISNGLPAFNLGPSFLEYAIQREMKMADSTRIEVVEDDFYDETEMFPCPHCGGFGHVDCHCGGDLCVCENYGEATCHVCGGDGEVGEARYDRYEENQRRNYAAMSAILAKAKGGA